jgi:hypothetical protein
MSNEHQVTIGHLSFTSPSNLNFTTDKTTRTFSLSGTIAHTSGNQLDLDEVKYIRDEMASMAKYGVFYPLTYTGDSSLKGYCKIESSSVDISRYGGAGVRYSISGEWLGNPGEIRFESQFSGALLDNDHSITSSTSQFFAVPEEAFSVHIPSVGTGTAPAVETRIANYGAGTANLKYFSGSAIRANNVEFECNPSDYLKGAVKVSTNGKVRNGLLSPNDNVDQAVLENGLVKFELVNSNTQSRFTISLWDSDDWRSVKEFAVSKGTSQDEWLGWNTVQIIKNYAECATLRFTSQAENDGSGRLTFDVSLRRGSRYFSLIVHSYGNADEIRIQRTTTEASSSGTGYIVSSTNDSEGNFFILGSPNTFSEDLTEGGIYLTATQMKAFVGFCFDGTSAAGENTADNMRDSYFDYLYEHVRVIRS